MVRRALAALDRRDVEAYLEVASPQIELMTFALALQGRQGPITGHEGIRDYFGELWSFSEASGLQVEEIGAVEGRVLAFFVITATGAQGIQTSVRAAGVWDIEDGKIRRAQIFETAPKPSKPWGCRSSAANGPTAPHYARCSAQGPPRAQPSAASMTG